MRLRDRAVSFFWQQCNHFVVILAIPIYAIMVSAPSPAQSWSAVHEMCSFVLLPDPIQLHTKFCEMGIGARKNISIKQPSPCNEKFFWGNDGLRFHDLGFWNTYKAPILECSRTYWERYVGFLLPCKLFFVRFITIKGFGRKLLNRRGSGSVARILPSCIELENILLSGESFLYGGKSNIVKHDIGAFNGVQGLSGGISGIPGSTSGLHYLRILFLNFRERIMRSLRRSVAGAINTVGEGGIDTQTPETKNLNYERRIIQPMFLCLAGFMVMVFGYWRLRFCSSAKDLCLGTIGMFVGWPLFTWGTAIFLGIF